MSEKIDNSIVGVRSNHNLSFNWLGSSEFGRITPFHVLEVVPTDNIKKIHPVISCQMLPLASPTFGKMDIYCHYFYVPTRCIWDNADAFFSGQGVGKDSIPPYIKAADLSHFYSGHDAGAKREYYKFLTSMGLPPFFHTNSNTPQQSEEVRDDKLSVLPFRAYQRIWWDFYRDTELYRDDNEEFILDKRSGDCDPLDQDAPISAVATFGPHYRSIKDLWISSLFAEQGGSTNPFGVSLASVGVNPGIVTPGAASTLYSQPNRKVSNGAGSPANATTSIGELSPEQLRKIEALTRMSERLTLSGKRQIDQLFARYGVRPEFSKLSMSQYIGGGKSSVLVQDITATADTLGQTGDFGYGSALGQKAASGYCSLSDIDIDFHVPEHGYIIGVLSVMPKFHFVQGLGRQWYRNSREDWFTRELEHVGQVAVPRKEIGTFYATMNGNANGYSEQDGEATFAFTQPYYEYKRAQDVLAGDFMYYHNSQPENDDETPTFQYMQSMGLYADYPYNREYNVSNMIIPASQLNNIFVYRGGFYFDNTDDHFHLDIDVECIVERPMDGFAVPTLETTANPHLATTTLQGSTQL